MLRAAVVRREGAFLAAVVVPFAALVALGVWHGCAGGDEAVFATAGAQAAPVSQVPVPTPAVAPTTVAVDAGSASEVALEEPVPLQLEAPVRAVRREIHACVYDNGAHLHGAVAVDVAFRPTRDGGFDGVQVESRFANPQLTACLEDVFSEVSFAPTGHETFEPVRYRFVVDLDAH